MRQLRRDGGPTQIFFCHSAVELNVEIENVGLIGIRAINLMLGARWDERINGWKNLVTLSLRSLDFAA